MPLSELFEDITDVIMKISLIRYDAVARNRTTISVAGLVG
jgi:hypothetical protein